MMIAFPILLMLILGTVFNRQFSGSSAGRPASSVLYYSETEGKLTGGFLTFAPELKKLNITVRKTDNMETALKKLADGEYSAIVRIDDNSQVITLFKNDKQNITASMIEGLLSAFIHRFNLISGLASSDPEDAGRLPGSNPGHEDLIEVVSINRGERAGAMDYYGISMLTLIIMYSINTGLAGTSREKYSKTSDRILLSPIKPLGLFISKVTGSLAVAILQTAIVIIFSITVLKVDYGDDLPTVLLILLTQIIMCVSAGVSIGFISKNPDTGNGITNILIPLLIFLGGGYYPLERIGSSFLIKISSVSPLRWINNTIFDVIYRQDYGNVGITLLICLLTGGIFLFFAMIRAHKMEKM